MLALELSVNGKPLATAGTAGMTSISCTVSAHGDELRKLKPETGPVVVRLGGSTHALQPANLATWLEAQNCSIGDVITLRVVETSEVTEPALTPYPPGIERALVPQRSIVDRLITFFTGGGRAAS